MNRMNRCLVHSVKVDSWKTHESESYVFTLLRRHACVLPRCDYVGLGGPLARAGSLVWVQDSRAQRTSVL